MSSSSSSESEDDNDISVIEDEDRALQAEIDKERKEKRAETLRKKREKAGKPPPKARNQGRKKPAAKKDKKVVKKRKRKGSDDDDEESESNSNSDDEEEEAEADDDNESEEDESEKNEDSSDSDRPRKRNTRAGFAKNGRSKGRAVILSSDSEEEVMPTRKTRTKVESDVELLSSDGKEDDENEEKSYGKLTRGKRARDGSESDDSLVLPTRKRNRVTKPTPAKPMEEEKKKKKRGLMDETSLAQETVDAEKAEKERRKRLEQKQKEFNGIELLEGVDLTEALIGTTSQRKLKSVIIDPDSKSDPPEPVEVHQSIVRILKPHQARGIQFMYDCTFESIDRLEMEGSGGILAHCMGLGKTLQVISYLHTVMMHPKTGEHCRRVLVVVPKNVIINWFKEFRKWLLDNDEELDTIDIAELDSYKTIEERKRALAEWHESETPSVMIIGYDMFRILTAEEDPKKKKNKSKKNKKFLRAQEDFRKYLQNPGPDLIVCDEAHKLKNDDSALSKTMTKIRTRRRICLTGTPLQNNLMEYHCMVNFVKPGLLGTKAEFANRFVNIINRGRTKDATRAEVQFMKRRCHVLYEHLKKVVDRKDYRVLMEAIPPKQEYVLNVRMTKRQCDLYRAFLNDVVGSEGLSKRLLPDYHVLSRIWTHPYQLILHEQKMERLRILREEEEEEEAFIDDGDSEEESEAGSYESESEEEDVVDLSDSDDDKKKKKKSVSKNNGKASTSSRNNAKSDDDDEENDPAMKRLQMGFRQSKRLMGDGPEDDDPERDTETPPEYSGWFSKLGLISEDDQSAFELSNKLVLLCAIIKKCEEIGDKILVFSQSLESLALIRRMLEYKSAYGQWFTDGHQPMNAEGETWSWLEGVDYMTIDGSVQSVKRDAVQTAFNDPENLRARLMLISTRAGSLGTNMVAANRVIIFDACWNPSHDTQSLFRVYRFGQTKPVYIYRLIAQGTMEERIYKRQVTKESTSMRVVDEAQIQRHYDGHDLQELYQFNPVELNEEDDDILPVFAPPKDRLLGQVVLNNKTSIVDYFEHDTLFANQEEEKLTEEEMKDAWNDYENDKRLPPMGVQSRFAGMGGSVGSTLADIQQQLMMREQQVQQTQKLLQLGEDPIFKECMKLVGMDLQIAMRMVILKKSLEQLLPFIPVDMRGGMNEFNTHFLKLIHETGRLRQNPQQLMSKGYDSFRTVIKLVEQIPACNTKLLELRAQYPYIFAQVNST